MKNNLATTNKVQRVLNVATPVNNPAPTHEAIALAAYFRAERRGFAPGGEFDDWFEAERELCQPSVRD